MYPTLGEGLYFLLKVAELSLDPDRLADAEANVHREEEHADAQREDHLGVGHFALRFC